MQPIGQHPYAMYSATPVSGGRLAIQFYCRRCGDRHQHICYQPNRLTQWLYRYAGIHAHGLVPRRPTP